MAKIKLTYGYARVSTSKQSIARQIKNIEDSYPGIKIFEDVYTGTKMDRPSWQKLLKIVREGDTIVFDELSRMSRNAEEGFACYKELYEKGINLVFLKESALNTINFKMAMQQIQMTGSDVDVILEGVNKYLMILAEKQIKSSFDTAQHEVDLLHKRTAEGIRQAMYNGKQIGRQQGRKVITKKSIKAKEAILKFSKKYGGANDVAEVCRIANISRNSYFRYVAEIEEELEKQN